MAAKLEHKAPALKAKALQHLFIALAGSDCKELWTLLVSFFGNGTGFDPFDFLDGAPVIKPPLDLGETDSDEETSETALSVSLGSVSTTASIPPTPVTSIPIPTPAAVQSSTLTAPTQAPHPILKPKLILPDKVSRIEYAEGCIPTSLSDIHHTSIPTGVACKRSEKVTSRGASLYICPHRDCGATPYVGNLYGCSSHLHRVHFGMCLICPYCPNQRYYRASGWKAHMSSKHSTVPWFGAPEVAQASLMLSAIQEEVSAPVLSQEPVKVKAEVPLIRLHCPEEISSVPFCPTQEEGPLEESLPFTPDMTEEDLTPKQEQELLEEEEATPRPPTPSTEAIKAASLLAPSDLRAYEYSVHTSAQHGTIMSHYPKSGDHSEELAMALVKQDLPAMSDDSPEAPPAKKSKPDNSTDDGTPSM